MTEIDLSLHPPRLSILWIALHAVWRYYFLCIYLLDFLQLGWSLLVWDSLSIPVMVVFKCFWSSGRGPKSLIERKRKNRVLSRIFTAALSFVQQSSINGKMSINEKPTEIVALSIEHFWNTLQSSFSSAFQSAFRCSFLQANCAVSSLIFFWEYFLAIQAGFCLDSLLKFVYFFVSDLFASRTKILLSYRSRLCVLHWTCSWIILSFLRFSFNFSFSDDFC